jgi:hypothetical protein
MTDRLLTWQRTDLPSKPRDDYTGRDLDRQRLYARIYRATGGTGTGEWFWTLAEHGAIESGYEATLMEAVDAAERVYRAWRGSQSGHGPAPRCAG